MSKIATLLLTNLHHTEEIVEGLEAGANDFLSKPYDDEELNARVAALIRSKINLERAEKAESIVQKLIDDAPDALLAVNSKGLITHANVEATQVLGRSSKELIGTAIRAVIPSLEIDALPRGSAAVRPVSDIVIGAEIYSPSIRLSAIDGFSATMISLRDVTARRQREACRLDFYSIIGHDLRSPLNAMLLRTEMMKQKFGSPPNCALTADLHKIQGNIRSMVDLINDFLELGRTEQLNFSMQMDPVELRALVADSAENLGPLFQSAGVEFTMPEVDGEYWTRGDSRRLSQVLSNLLTNAMKFTPRGGKVSASLTIAESMIEVAIVDTGRGIAADAIPALFRRYVRTVDADKNVLGTGLGLMIVREVIEAHGGTVGVASEPGKGSRFWFRLPHTGPER